MPSTDDLRPYLDMASGITEAALAKAAEAAQAFLSQGAATGAQATRTWEQVSDAGLDPDALAELIREEVDRVAKRLGFVRDDELAALRRQVERLEDELTQARQDAAAASIAAAAAAEEGSAVSREALTASVLESTRRIAELAGAVESVTGLAGGPWGRVAKDVAASAAGLVSSLAATAPRPTEQGRAPAAKTTAAPASAGSPKATKPPTPKTAEDGSGSKPSAEKSAKAKKKKAKPAGGKEDR